MDKVFELEKIFNFDGVKYENKMIYVDEIPIGIIQPSTIFGLSNNNYYASGSNGIISINKDSEKDQVISSLVRSGCIIFGSSQKVLEETLDTFNQTMLSRTSSYLLSISKNCDEFLEILKKIRKSKIAIIGCGGIGSLSAMILAGVGVKNLYLVDGDIIEDSNLNRQLFWTKNDIGEKKVNVLSREINNRYEDCSCIEVDSMITIENIFEVIENVDLIVLSADEPIGISTDLEQKIKKHGNNISVIHAGYAGKNLGLSLYNKDNKFDINQDDTINWIRHNEFIAPSYGPSNVELAGLISSIGVLTLAGTDLQKNFKMSWNSQNIPRTYTYKD